MSIPKFNFKFSKKTVDKMKELTIKGEKTVIEQSGTLCKPLLGNLISLEHECTGASCFANISEKQCKDNQRVGTFHTHPTESNQPSFGDITYAITNNDHFNCIGSVKKNDKATINCYSINPKVTKSDIEKIKNISSLDLELNTRGYDLQLLDELSDGNNYTERIRINEKRQSLYDNNKELLTKFTNIHKIDDLTEE